MKICFVHEEYPKETNFGGIATYQKLMAEYYANHGDEVIVIARGSKDCDYYENNVHVFRIKSENDNNSINSVTEYREKVSKILTKLQADNKIDIIETPDWGANTILFEKERKVPLVVRLHTPLKIWLKYNNNDFGAAKDLILKWEDEMLNKADSLTSCSQLLKDMVIDDYDINKEITVIPNPCNIKDFKNNTIEENNNMIFVGSLEERKGTIILAEALNKVFKEVANAKIYLVGKDTIRNNENISTKEYMLKIVDEEYHNRMIFTGQIDNDQVNKYLNLASLAIFPSIFDNYPYVVLEAMSAGKNIVISNNIGCVDILGKNNYIFESGNSNDLANKILDFYNQEHEYINKDNIKNVDLECHPDKICKEMKEIYEKAIKNYANK